MGGYPNLNNYLLKLRLEMAMLTGVTVLSAVLATVMVYGESLDIAPRSYSLPDQRTFTIQAPKAWREEVLASDNYHRRIKLYPSSGSPFEIYITPWWPVPGERATPNRAFIHSWVEAAANKAKEKSVETEVPLIALNGKSVQGFYFYVTDRAPKAGEFKRMTQGAFLTGNLWVFFTVLTNDGQEEVLKQALDMVKSVAESKTSTRSPTMRWGLPRFVGQRFG